LLVRAAGGALDKKQRAPHRRSGTIRFRPCETRQTIALWIRSDRKREGAETFTVRLSNASVAVIDEAIGTVTVLDND